MSSSNMHTPIIKQQSNTKGGSTVVQRRQRNPNVTGGGTSTSTTSLSYHQQHHEQHHHHSYYYGGRGTGGSIIDGRPSPSSSTTRERVSSNLIPPPPDLNTVDYHNVNYNPQQQQQQQPHVALHIDNYDQSNNNNRYYDESGGMILGNSDYDPEQPHQVLSPSSHATKHRMTEEQIRRFNHEQQHQPLPQFLSSTSVYRTSSNITPTSVMSNAHTIPLWKRKMVLEEDFYRIEDYHTIFRNPHHMTDAQYTKYAQLQQQYIDSSGMVKPTTTTSTSMMNKTCCAYTCSMFSAIAVVFLLWVGIILDTQPLYIPGALPTITVLSVTQQQAAAAEPPYSSTTNEGNDYKQKQQKGQGRKQQKQNQSQSSRRTTPRIQFIIPGNNDERLVIAKTAYQAAAMYFITMIISRYIYDPIPFHSFYNTFILSFIQRYCGRITGQHRGFPTNRSRQRHFYTDIPELQSQCDMIGHYSTNTAVSSSTSMEGLILSGGVGGNGIATNGGNGITLLPYATTAPQRSSWFATTAATTSLWTRTSNTMKRYLASKGWYQPSRRRNRHHYEIKKTG